MKSNLDDFAFFSPECARKGAGGTGYNGFYYHFLDMHTRQRAFASELSTVDTAYLVAGMLVTAAYFDRDTREEEVRHLAHVLYRRIDWNWASNRSAYLTHCWKPESGFLKYLWEGYDESLLLYILALGSPTHAIRPDGYATIVL